jgi:hypothetical protein
MKVEIMGLWGIIFLLSYLSIKNLMVVGDSKVTMDWINDKSNLNIIYLNNWKGKIRILKNGFETIKFMHIHRQFNKVANNLSKKALKGNSGWIYYE